MAPLRSPMGSSPPWEHVGERQLVSSPNPCTPFSEHLRAWLSMLSTISEQVECSWAGVSADRAVPVEGLAELLLPSPGDPGEPVPVAVLRPVPGVVGTVPWSVALAGLVARGSCSSAGTSGLASNVVT